MVDKFRTVQFNSLAYLDEINQKLAKMNSFLILLFCCSAGVLAHPRCFGRGSAKVENIPEGCHIANLTITTRSSEKITDGKTLCNNTVHHKTFDYKFENVSFKKMAKKVDPNVRYLILAKDLTDGRLLWMTSNLTLSSELQIFPSGFSVYEDEIVAEHKPYLTKESPSHLVEFYVFEEFRRRYWSRYLQNNALYDPPFDLQKWLEYQKRSSITLCGPVAGARVTVVRN